MSEQTSRNIHHLSQVSQRDICLGKGILKAKIFAESQQTSHIYHSSLIQDRARGKRKPILRSEASPPKFFIPEQKGKVVYKVPGDRGAIPSSSKYLQKGHLPLHHLLFTRSNALFAASVSVNFLKPSRPNRIQYTTIYCQSSVAQTCMERSNLCF